MASKPSKPAKKTSSKVAARKSTAAKVENKKSAVDALPLAKPVLSDVRAKIDQIDRSIQALIAERARFAHQVGKAKGKLAAAVDYYRPEREAQVLRMVVDRNQGPLSDEVLVRLFREIMSACLAQQEPLKVGFLGPEGTFSQQAVFKHFGHSATGFPLASIGEVFDEVGMADNGMVIDPEYLQKYCHIPFTTEALNLKASGVRNVDALVLTEASCLVLRYPKAHMRIVMQ